MYYFPNIAKMLVLDKSLTFMEDQEEKEGNRVETIVKIAVLIWSGNFDNQLL